MLLPSVLGGGVGFGGGFLGCLRARCLFWHGCCLAVYLRFVWGWYNTGLSRFVLFCLMIVACDFG